VSNGSEPTTYICNRLAWRVRGAEPVVCGAVEGPFAALAAGGLTIACSRLRSGVYVYCALAEAGVGMVFIVQGKPREPEGIVKVIRQTRKEALETANDFLNEGFPFVSIVGDGRVYTVKEFATTVGNDEPE
jgi:hypothetical protein